MKKLAIKYQIEIFWFYGETEHGTGLVDAMSSFGCKKVLRSVIINEDKWFKDLLEMVRYLKEFFENDNTKSYFHIEQSETAKKGRVKRKEHPIQGCQKHVCIAFNPDGELMTKRTLDIGDDTIFELKFKPDYEGCGLEEDEDEEVTCNQADHIEVLDDGDG